MVMSEDIALSRLALTAIEQYETVTGYTVIIEQDPITGDVTWTDIDPTGLIVDITVIPAEDTTEPTTR